LGKNSGLFDSLRNSYFSHFWDECLLFKMKNNHSYGMVISRNNKLNKPNNK